MRLKSPLFVLLILAVIALFFLNTWQGFRYEQLKRSVRELEIEQKDWLERNKKVIAALAVMSSPARVEALARQRLRLRTLQAGEAVKVVIKDSGND